MKKRLRRFSDYPDILNFQEFCEALGLGETKAYQLLQSGQISYFRIGRPYFIPKKCVIEYLSKLAGTDIS